MAGLVFLAGLCELAAMSVPSVLLTPISINLGGSISQLSGPLGLRVALFGLVAPFAGGLILLYGPRAVYGLRGALDRWPSPRHHDECEVGIMAGPRRPHGIAPGLTAIAMAATIATRWFTAPRGLCSGSSAQPARPGN